MLKILQIIPSLRKGGAERLVLDICIALSKTPDVEVCLVTFSHENEYAFLSEQIHHKVIPSFVVPSLSGKAKVQITDLLAFIHDFKPQVIHSHLFEAEMVSRQVLLTGVKYFSHCHDNMHQLRSFTFGDIFSKKRFTELYEKYLITKQYRRCDNNFIAISRHAQQYFTKVLPSSLKAKVYLLPNAIDFDSFNKASKHEKGDELLLINVGSFVAKKNQAYFIPVVAALNNKGINCKVILLGDGALKQSIEVQIKLKGLTHQFMLPGNVSNVVEYLSKATLYAHTATYEPFGLVLLEAMAAGLPVVTLNGGGNADIMENGKNGFIIDEQDPELFAEKILEIWNNKELYKQMSNYAQEYAMQYDIKPYVDKLLTIYKGC